MSYTKIYGNFVKQLFYLRPGLEHWHTQVLPHHFIISYYNIYIYIFVYIYTYCMSIFTLIIFHEIQIYNPNKKVFVAGMKQKRGKKVVSKTWNYNASDIPFHIIVP